MTENNEKPEKSEGKYQSLFNVTNDGIFIIDKKSKLILSVNDRGSKLLGYSEMELLGKPVTSLYHKDELSLISKYIKKLIKEGSIHFEAQQMRKDGSLFDVEVSSKVVEYDGRQVFQSFVRDITKRKRADKEIRILMEYLDTILLNLPVGVAILEGEEFRFFRINKALADIIGMPVKAHLGKPINELLPISSNILHNLRKVRKTGQISANREFTLKISENPDRILHLVDWYFPIMFDGKPKAVGTVVIDITEKKKVELELRRREAFSKSITESAADAIIGINSDGIILSWNKSAEKFFGYSGSEMLNKDLTKMIPNKLTAGRRAGLKRLKKGDRDRLVGKTTELIAFRKDGTKFPVELSLSKWEVENKKYYTGIIRDITERKETEEVVSNYNLHLMDLVHKKTDEIEEERTIAESLYRVALILCSTFDINDLLKIILVELRKLIPFDCATMQMLNQDQFEIVSCLGFSNETKVLGTTFDVESDIFLKNFKSRYDPFIIENVKKFKDYKDRSDGKKIKSSMGVPLILADEIIGIIVLDKFHQHFFTKKFTKIARAFAANASISIENARLYKISQEAKEKAENALIQLKETQSQLIHSEKMASLGQLTAGVAHELNNPINSINASVVGLERELKDIFYLLEEYSKLEKLPADQKTVDHIQKFKHEIDLEYVKRMILDITKDLRSGSKRTAGIISGLRKFSRIETDLKQRADIHEGINDTLALLGSILKGKVNVIKQFDKKIEEIDCYPGELNQVFMNLFVNAEQAIDKKGTITISTKNFQSHLKIIVTDNGMGMDNNKIKKIFEPFYTTKSVGAGTGLGLSISYGIIEKHGGSIMVRSKIGKGSAFTIKLPKK